MKINQILSSLQWQRLSNTKKQKQQFQSIRNNYSKSIINPKYYQALNAISFTGSEPTYFVDINKSIEQLLATKIFSILNGQQNDNMELLDDIITLTNCPDAQISKDEGDEEVRSALCSALSDSDDSHFVENILNGIEDGGKKIEIAMVIKNALSKNRDVIREANISKSELYARQIMQLSKTKDNYDFSNLNAKLNLVRRIDNVEENTKPMHSNISYFDIALNCSTDENGEIDLAHMDALSHLLSNYEFQNPPIEEISNLIKKSVAKSPEQKDLIMANLIKLSEEYSLNNNGFETAFNHCFENSRFSVERFVLLLDFIDSLDNADRCRDLADEVVCSKEDIDYNELCDEMINSFFLGVVNTSKGHTISSKQIDSYVAKKFKEVLSDG